VNNNHLKPTFKEEKILLAQGYTLIAGVDEVGRGALAGPVVAAAVILPTHVKGCWVAEVRDSKFLPPAKREILSRHIHENALAVSIGMIDSDVINTEGIAKATRLAMKQAILHLPLQPQYLLIDFFKLPEVNLPQKGVVDGDSLCFSIACASIVAKVARDALMVKLDSIHPGYGLADHKGYSTAEHLACLRRLGPSPIHRSCFQPVMEVIPPSE
jgi:ribonuclease HII